MEQLAIDQQIQTIHALLYDLGMMDDIEMYMQEFTNYPKNSIKELTTEEATCLIKLLFQQSPAGRCRATIVKLAHRAGIIYGDTLDDYRLNIVKLDVFLFKNGAVKKELAKMNINELVQVTRQMEEIIKNNWQKKNKKAAKEATTKLLKELNITVK